MSTVEVRISNEEHQRSVVSGYNAGEPGLSPYPVIST
jgi:hypothetical protein